MTVVFCFFFTNCRKITKNAVCYVTFLQYHIIRCLKTQPPVGMYKTRGLSRAVSWTGPQTDFSISRRNCRHIICHLLCHVSSWHLTHTILEESWVYLIKFWDYDILSASNLFPIAWQQMSQQSANGNYCQICPLVKIKNCRLKAHRIKSKNSIKWCLAVLQINRISTGLTHSATRMT